MLAVSGVALAADSGRYRGSTFELGSIRLTIAGNRVTVVHYITGMDCVDRGPSIEAGEDTEPYHEDVERTFRPRALISGNRFRYRKSNAAGTRIYSLTGRVKGRTIRGAITEYQVKKDRDGDEIITTTCRGKDKYTARMR